MESKQLLQQIVQDKIESQAVLRGIKSNLVELDGQLDGSKFGRFFGSTYWFVKRWIALFLGLAMIVLGVLFITNPSSIITEGNRFFDHMLIEYKVYFVADFGASFLDLANAVKAMESPTPEDLLFMLNDQADEYMIDKLYLHLGFFGAVLILMAFFMLYISRQARKVKLRNRKISDAETLTQKVAKQFQHVIEEEEKELDKLKSLLQKF